MIKTKFYSHWGKENVTKNYKIICVDGIITCDSKSRYDSIQSTFWYMIWEIVV